MKEFPNRLKCELNPPKSVVFPGDTIQVRFSDRFKITKIKCIWLA
jgi:hypothetical protein